jgi:Ca2+-binding RTX toxin-like protein
MANSHENGTSNGADNDGLIGFGRGEFILDDDGSNLIETGAGSDIVIGAAGNDTISTGNGFDFIGLSGDPDGANEVNAGGHADIILGGGGSDLLDGGNGYDQIIAGGGDDTIIGGKGKDTLTGGDGADTFVLHERGKADLITDFDVSADFLQAEAGFNDGAISTPEDLLSLVTYTEQGAVLDLGRNNVVTLEGVAEGELTVDNFVVTGGDDDDGDDEHVPGDPVLGDDEDNTLEGTDEGELVFGAAGNDLMIGSGGDDTLRGGQGDDDMDGGDGHDQLISGQGADSMTGGEGDDVFVYLFGHGEDTILDFNLAGDDRLQLQSEMGETLLLTNEQVLEHVTYNEEGAVIDFGEENSLALVGVQEGSLTADDFELIG